MRIRLYEKKRCSGWVNQKTNERWTSSRRYWSAERLLLQGNGTAGSTGGVIGNGIRAVSAKPATASFPYGLRHSGDRAVYDRRAGSIYDAELVSTLGARLTGAS